VLQRVRISLPQPGSARVEEALLTCVRTEELLAQPRVGTAEEGPGVVQLCPAVA